MTTAVAEQSWHVVVPHHARGARAARHRLSDVLAGEVPAALLADVVAVAGELLGNAVRHARPLPGDVIRMAWSLRMPAALDGDTTEIIEVRVTDGGAGQRPSARAAGPESLDGRGLHIVAALASRWGVDEDGGRQSVWAEIRTHARMVMPS